MEQLYSRPDYLVLGHVSKDALPITPGYAPGGTALYSALTAQHLGLQAAIVTSYAQVDEAMLKVAHDAGIWMHRIDAPKTTTFHNTYDSDGRRRQVISAQAAPLSYADVPPAWLEAPIVHLGPIAQELPYQLPGAFTRCLLGITPQGWMRSWNQQGNITRTAWPVPDALANLPPNAFLVLSLEDLDYSPDLIRHYQGLAPLVAITNGQDEAYLYERGQVSKASAFTADVVDPTGAGDVFAAALFTRYKETSDLITSARFAHAAAACNIEGQGPSAIADRAGVEGRLKPG